MSDSFADLWNASAPPSSSSTATSSSSNRTKPDVFALLASNGAPGVQRYGTGSRPITPFTRSTNTTPAPSSTAKPNSGDAFGDLLSSLNPGTNANRGGAEKMTLAARLAHEAEERRKGSAGVGGGPLAHQEGGAWVGLDILGGGVGGTVESKAIHDDDDWGLGDFGTSAAKLPQVPRNMDTTQPIPKPGGSLWDLDEFTKDGDRDHGVVPRRNENLRAARLLDLDFHDVDNEEGSRSRDRAQGLLESDDSAGESSRHGGTQEEDDILGMLSRPVDEVKVKKASSSTLSRPPTHPTQRAPSPPPHILGQIVEMGFSVAQAKKALAGTPSGMDVPGAVEALLGGGAGGGVGTSVSTSTSTTPAAPERERTRGPPKGQKERERERLERQRQLLSGSGSGSQRESVLDRDAPSSTPTLPVHVAELQGQADKLISQASEIGISVLGRASAFWKEGKERVGRAYEEKVAAPVGERSGSRLGGKLEGGGRPRWMQDDRDGEGEDEGGELSGFKDDLSPVGAKGSLRHVGAEEEVHPFSPNPTLARRPPLPQIASTSVPITAPSRTQQPLRPLPSTTPSTALQYKTTGTAQFKLGQYAAACEAYSLAIAALPTGHLLLVPLYTNRALGRLRTGEYREAEVDTEMALEVICGGEGRDDFDRNATMGSGNGAVWKYPWSPAQEHPSILNAAQNKVNDAGWTHPQGLGVDLVDGYVKAVKRRSEALEGREKWEDAGRGWEVLSAGWVAEGVRKEALRGAGRCRGMVGGGANAATTLHLSKSATASIPTKPVSLPNSRGKPKLPTSILASSEPQQPSAALLALRNATAQADADDTLKHQLKDSVDVRLDMWRKGKEGNVRALLASLDLVLWEELLNENGGGKGIGGVKISALVTPAQVKKGYVRVIGRVHPDKLNPSNSTVEQRMLANGVFGTLNEAWVIFQRQGS